MPVHNIYGVWRIAFTLMALSTNGLVSAMRTSLSDHENDMMADGTFVYGTLSAVKKAALFKDFVKANGIKVIITRRSTEWLMCATAAQCAELILSLSLTTDVVQNKEGQRRQIHAIPGESSRN